MCYIQKHISCTYTTGIAGACMLSLSLSASSCFTSLKPAIMSRAPLRRLSSSFRTCLFALVESHSTGCDVGEAAAFCIAFRDGYTCKRRRGVACARQRTQSSVVPLWPCKYLQLLLGRTSCFEGQRMVSCMKKLFQFLYLGRPWQEARFWSDDLSYDYTHLLNKSGRPDGLRPCMHVHKYIAQHMVDQMGSNYACTFTNTSY